MPEEIPGTKVVEVPITPPTLTAVIPPVTVTVIKDKETLPSGTVIPMPGDHPNIIQNVVTPFVAILVRAINLFLITLSGLITGGLTPAGSKLLGAPDFYHLILISAGFAVAPVGVGLIKDLITVFGKLEQKYPLGTGSI